MPARTGAQFLQGLRERPRELWIDGARVADPVEHPAFRNVVRSVAALYDMQHDPRIRGEMTYVSPSTGDPVGLSFLMPRTHDDLVRVRGMMKRWADYSGGFMGRTPDYLNRALVGYASASAYCGENDPRFGDHIRRYYEYVREHDLCLTHTLIHPQANRSVGPSQQADPFLAARIAEETPRGVVLRGARMLATLPTADEIMVFPSTLLKAGPDDAPYAYAVALPTETPGLRFLCRESFDYGKSPFDHPLAARFEEMDAVVIFDDVLVPWERVFLLWDVDKCNRAFAATGAVAQMAHQVVTKNVAKTEFVLGVASLIVDALGGDPAAARRVRVHGHPGGARPRGAAGGHHPAVLSSGARGRGQPHQAVPARVGHRPERVRVAPGAVRALLLRRPGADGGRDVQRVRPPAVHGAGPGVPGARRPRRPGARADGVGWGPRGGPAPSPRSFAASWGCSPRASR